MIKIIKNSFLVFRRNKDYFMTMILGPLSILIIASLFLTFDTKSTVAVVNGSESEFGHIVEDMFSDSDAFDYKSISEEELNTELAASGVDIVVAVSCEADNLLKSGTSAVVIYSAKGDSDLKAAVEEMITSAEDIFINGARDYSINTNPSPKKTIPIGNSLGLTMFRIISGGSLLIMILLNDKKRGVRGRVQLSGVSSFSYLAGMSTVFLISSMISSVTYFLTALICRLYMGLSNDLLLLPVLFVTNIFSVCFAVFLSTLIKNEQTISTILAALALPATILGGGVLPYEKMPRMLQNISEFIPQRWILHSLEILQGGKGFKECSGYLLLTLLFSAVLFTAGAVLFKKQSIVDQ